jgi:predicted MFS family arabinose efflux permease
MGNDITKTASVSRTIAWSLWFVISMFYSYQYMLRVMPSIMMDDILKQFNINVAIFGQCSGIYYIAYSLLHLPIGVLLDKFGIKKIIPIFILFTVAGLIFTLLSKHWLGLIFGRVLIGMGSSAAILGTFKNIHMNFKKNQFSRILSFSVAIGLLGAIYGGAPVELICNLFGYKVAIIIFIFIGIFLSILVYCISPSVQHKNPQSFITGIKNLCSSYKVFPLCIFSGLMVGPLEGFADVWGCQFFKLLYGFEGTTSASLPSIIFLGMCLGSPVLSLIASRIGNLYTIICAGIIMAISFIKLLTGGLSIGNISIMLFIVGVCCSYQIIAIHQASTYVKESMIGLTTAVANMIIMIFGYLFHAVIGLLINTMGGLDNPQAFLKGIAVIPVGLILGVFGVIAILLKERPIKI